MAKTLTKRDLVNKISAETNFTQIEVFDIVQRAVDIISSTLAEGDRVVIRNFGTFQVKEVKPKVGRNPKNPDQDVPSPARSVVKFKVGKELKDQVAKLTASKYSPQGSDRLLRAPPSSNGGAFLFAICAAFGTIREREHVPDTVPSSDCRSSTLLLCYRTHGSYKLSAPATP